MSYKATFERCEFKYLLTKAQKERLLSVMEPYMMPDIYGKSIIRNVYYDTENYRLARNSIEKPVYKEKLRLRSYKMITPSEDIFVELKKKYRNTVYKRRISLPESTAADWINGSIGVPGTTQISNEIDYFIHYYGELAPAAFLSYEREAFCVKDGGTLRITFDENILCRQDRLSLHDEIYGYPILPDGTVLLEIKCSGAMPLWLTNALSEEKIYKTSFSKYGLAYKKMIFPKKIII